MLLLAHVQGNDIGLTMGGLAVINKSFFLAVSLITCLCDEHGWWVGIILEDTRI